MTSLKPAYRTQFAYVHPITVRYADLDPQQHVNNAAVVTYLESARMGYYQACGIWDGRSFDSFGMVVAALHIDYRNPIRFEQAVEVWMSVIKIGTKSLRFAFQVIERGSSVVFAQGEIIMVAFDSQAEKSVPIPPVWCEKILQFEQQGETHDSSSD